MQSGFESLTSTLIKSHLLPMCPREEQRCVSHVPIFIPTMHLTSLTSTLIKSHLLPMYPREEQRCVSRVPIFIPTMHLSVDL
jgi:hypothetical protein